MKEIGNIKVKLTGINTKTKDSVATIDVTLEVENLNVLNKVMKSLRKVESVFEVRRKT